MTDNVTTLDRMPPRKASGFAGADAQIRLAQRRRADTRFRIYGLAAILLALLFLVLIIADIIIKAWPALHFRP